MSPVEQAIVRAVGGLLPIDGTVLIACSGGADSVALAAAAASHAKLRIVLGHVDHGLRPDSGSDAETVRRLAADLGVSFVLERLQAPSTKALGLEGAAREARYPALARLAAAAGARVVATAHTRRDRAETLLLRLARGAGPGGLAGVRPRRELAPGIALVRPLLDVSREETEAECRRRNLTWIVDPHNSDPARMRARVRALWPQLLALNPRLEEALAGAAALLAEEDEFLAAEAQRAAGEILRARTLSGLPVVLARRALLTACVNAGLRPERGHLDAALRLCGRGGTGEVHVPGGIVRIAPDGLLSFVAPASKGAGEVASDFPARYASNLPEMDASSAAFPSQRQVDGRSASMRRGAVQAGAPCLEGDEEPR